MRQCESPRCFHELFQVPVGSNHQIQEYLEQVNAGLAELDWQLYCLRFAPNAPQQNPVEDIWLLGEDR